MLREEIEYLGPVRLSNVEQTQQQIVDIVRTLEDAGEITVHGDEEDRLWRLLVESYGPSAAQPAPVDEHSLSA